MSHAHVTLRKPPRLTLGAHVRVLSLSAPVAALCPRRFERGLENLGQMGFVVSLGESATARIHHMAGSAEARAADLVHAWNDPAVDAILSTIGGSVTLQILEHLPFDQLQRPKALVGYSDTTVLMLALRARWNHVSFHGPSLMAQLGEFGGMPACSRQSFLDALQSEQWCRVFPPLNVVVEEHLQWERDDNRPRALVQRHTRRCLRPGLARGPLLVANMGSLLLLTGTAYMPSLRDVLLVLEEDETETPGSIDSYLTQMRYLGIWDQIAGLVVGRFPLAVGISDEVLDEMLLRTTRGTSCPILVGFEVGHVDPAFTLPIGVMAELVAHSLSLTQLECATI